MQVGSDLSGGLGVAEMITPFCEQHFKFRPGGWNPCRPLIFRVNWIANKVIEGIVNCIPDMNWLIILGFIQSSLAAELISGEAEQSRELPFRKEWSFGRRLQAFGDDLMIGFGEHDA